MVEQALRFGGVGIAATLMHVTAAFVAGAALGLKPYSANAMGFSFAFVVSYLGHFYWTFERRTGHGQHLARFLILSLGGYALSNLIVWVVVTRLGQPFTLALAAIAVLVPALTFVLSRAWAFHPSAAGLGANGFVLVSVAVAAAFYPQYTLNHDTSWYLVATRKWLEGAVLYRDVMEINPPLAFYLTAPSIYLADILGISENTAFCLVLVGLIGLSLLWVASLLSRSARRMSGGSSPAQRGRGTAEGGGGGAPRRVTTGEELPAPSQASAIPGTGLSQREAMALLIGFVAALLVVPMGYFGQREHLMMALTAPYFAALILRPLGLAPSRWEGVALGAVALMGFALKPHFLIAPLMLIVVSAWRERSLGPVFLPANLSLAAGCAAYPLAVAVLHPQYFEIVVPLARLVYDSYNADWADVIFKFPILLLLAAVLVWKHFRADEVGWRTLSVCVGFLASYLLQFKGWDYQLMPLAGYLAVFSIWVAATFREEAENPVAHRAALIVAFAALIHAAIGGPYQNVLATRFAAFAAGLSERSSILVLSTNVSAAFPLVNELEAVWTSRYPTQWLIPGAVRRLAGADCTSMPERCAAYGSALEYARRTIVEDFLAGSPEIVYVDVRKEKSYFGGVPFDYVSFLSREPAFAGRWKAYAKTGETLGYEVWSLRH